MRRKLLLVLGVSTLVAVTVRATTLPNASEAEVREALQHYLQGHATGDGSHFRQVFHPDSRLHFNRDGKFTSMTAEEYISRSRGTPAPDEGQRKRRILDVDVTGDAAVAKVELDYPTTYFIDYFTLLKIDGKWMIMNKTFNARPRQ